MRVLCGVRHSSDTAFLKTLDVEIINVDFNDAQALENAMKPADMLIHTAGLVNDWSSYKEFYETNVVLTQKVLKAALNCGIRDVIVTGSNASYGEENSTTIKSENSPPNPRYPYFLDKLIPNRLNHYRVTKCMASCQAMRFAEEHNLNLTVLEPVWVFGEREFSSGFYEYMKIASTKIPFFPGSSHNKFHVIYAGDLAKAYLQVCTKKLTGIHRFLLGNETVDRMEDIYAAFCKEMGVKKPHRLPKQIMVVPALLMELFAECFRFKKPPLLSRSRLNMFYDNIQYSTSRARELIGFRQDTSLESGIRRTVKWYKENKLIG